MQLLTIAALLRTAGSAFSTPKLEKPQTNQELRDFVAANPDTTELDLSFSSDISDITALAPLRHLQMLNLTGSNVKNLSVLNQLHDLEELRAIGTPVTELHLADLPRLRQVNLTNSQLKSLSLANLPKLETLLFENTKLTSLSHLSALPSLRMLFLAYTSISEVSHLRNFPSLQFVDLRYTLVSDISSLADLPKLNALKLNVTRVVDFPEALVRRGLLNGYSRIYLKIGFSTDRVGICAESRLSASSLKWFLAGMENNSPVKDRLFKSETPTIGFRLISSQKPPRHGLIPDDMTLSELDGQTVFILKQLPPIRP